MPFLSARCVDMSFVLDAFVSGDTCFYAPAIRPVRNTCSKSTKACQECTPYFSNHQTTLSNKLSQGVDESYLRLPKTSFQTWTSSPANRLQRKSFRQLPACPPGKRTPALAKCPELLYGPFLPGFGVEERFRGLRSLLPSSESGLRL